MLRQAASTENFRWEGALVRMLRRLLTRSGSIDSHMFILHTYIQPSTLFNQSLRPKKTLANQPITTGPSSTGLSRSNSYIC
jgi:hypothetical protein